MATAPTRVRYSPELQEAIAKQAQQRRGTGPLSPQAAAGGGPIPAPDAQSEPRNELVRACDVAVREAVLGLAGRFAEVLVSLAWTASEEGAEVSGDRSTLGLRILPGRFADPPGLTRFLRHELGQVADILDATFGYGAGGPEGLAVSQALRRRFSLLWDCSIDGRIARAGAAPLHAREEYEAEFVRLFPWVPSDVAGTSVGRLWEGSRPPYRGLMHMAADVAASPEAPPSGSSPAAVEHDGLRLPVRE